MFLSAVTTPTYPRDNLVSFERFIDGVMKTSQKPKFEQDASQYKMEIDIPGVSKDQVNISIEGHIVRFKTTEQAKRSYSEGYELPGEIDPTTSTAKLEDGVLYLTLAKKVQMSKASTLPVL
jgi:HSP20 family molecular chaperone IbpA